MKMFAVIFVLASVALVSSADVEVQVTVEPASALETKTALPYLALYEDIHRGGAHIFFHLIAKRCYKTSDIGYLNNIASQVDSFANCVDLYDDDECSGKSLRITATTPKECLENLVKCPQDMNDKISSFRSC